MILFYFTNVVFPAYILTNDNSSHFIFVVMNQSDFINDQGGLIVLVQIL